MSDQPTGSCRCNAVTFEVKNPLQFAANCHCNICKKTTGGAFSSIAIVDEADLVFTAGENLLSEYAISENASKYFCSKCGSPVYNRHKKFRGKLMLPIGALDKPGEIAPVVNVHCENMLPWVPNIMKMTNFDRDAVK
ncbi:hypothetical protein DESUT3_00550 [Desulfuromonas versatilis]|uniref:CENP-V/GFA domain-containing protein n=1 Tax=Desulfuromonas versatilis TaxID=2802975 RepID=A0ABM8HQC4_9BACT|nr:GFA family protein [Desulfuromonas versatilis]BCR02986.1 hypothetical protein DESUT3_00550 [Desulfuromonas versatilis]